MTATNTDTAGVIARPPLLYAGFLLAGVALDYLWPLDTLRDLAATPRYVAAGALFLIGGAVAVPALLGFRAAGTNVPTWLPTTALVTGGPYRFSRNPIYVGLSLAYVSLALALAAAWSLVLLVPLLVVVRYGVIAREEAYLERKFGDAYRNYAASVRRWL
jgi:protein-S-isoprenylcysteine O-methyltransferase Ste14